MNVKDFFQEISGDYESVMLRFPSEDFALKFIIRFLDDTSFEDLCRNLEEGNYGEAFRAAHNLKGLGLSLGFTPLGKSAGLLSQALSSAAAEDELPEKLEILLAEVSSDYNKTVEAIRKLKG